MIGDSNNVEGKKFSRIVIGMLDRLEFNQATEELRGAVGEVAIIQARLCGKENLKVENKKLGNVMTSIQNNFII